MVVAPVRAPVCGGDQLPATNPRCSLDLGSLLPEDLRMESEW